MASGAVVHPSNVVGTIEPDLALQPLHHSSMATAIA